MKEETQKSNDVEITEDTSFRDMMLSDQVLAGLTKCNFVKPSPIQLRAIPIGRCGLGKRSMRFSTISKHYSQIYLKLIKDVVKLFLKIERSDNTVKVWHWKDVGFLYNNIGTI